jgi:hypothetical protein
MQYAPAASSSPNENYPRHYQNKVYTNTFYHYHHHGTY